MAYETQNLIISQNTFSGLINELSYIEQKKSKADNILFCLLFTAGWFFLPALSALVYIALLYKVNFTKRVETFLFLLISLSIGLIGYTTKSVGTSETDIARYYFSYEMIAQVHSVKDFALSFIIDGGNNIAFYIITYLMTRLFPENPQVMPLFWVSFTYFFTFLTIRKAASLLPGVTKKLYMAVIFFAIAGVITFFTVTEILKQVASVSLFTYALVKRIKKEKYASLILIISILVHFSSMLLLPVYFFSMRKQVMKYIPVLFIGAFILSFFNFNELLYFFVSKVFTQGDFLDRVKYYENIDTWTISLRYYGVFAMYLLMLALFFWDYYKSQITTRDETSLLIVHSIAFLILLINRNNTHNFVRYLLGYFPFYIIAVMQMFTLRIARFDRIILSALIVGFYVYSNVKMLIDQTVIGGAYGNSYMNNNILDIATSSVIGFLHFRISG